MEFNLLLPYPDTGPYHYFLVGAAAAAGVSVAIFAPGVALESGEARGRGDDEALAGDVSDESQGDSVATTDSSESSSGEDEGPGQHDESELEEARDRLEDLEDLEDLRLYSDYVDTSGACDSGTLSTPRHSQQSAPPRRSSEGTPSRLSLHASVCCCTALPPSLVQLAIGVQSSTGRPRVRAARRQTAIA